MKKYRVSMDYERFKRKPDSKKQYKDFTRKSDGSIITETMILGTRVGQVIEELSISQIAEKAAINGQCWSPFIFKTCPTKKKRRRVITLFQECELIGLDFDQGDTFTEIMERCEELDLNPSIVHETFSSSSKLRKYRVIFALHKVHYQAELVNLTIRSLLSLFPTADVAAKDLARIFYGSNTGALHIDEDAVNHIEISDQIRETYEESRFAAIGDSLRDDSDSTYKYGDLKLAKEEYKNSSPEQQTFMINTLKKAKERIACLSPTSEESRYSTLFSEAERLVGIKGLLGFTIYNNLLQAVESNDHFKGWNYDPEVVILSAIKWKSECPNVKAGLLYEAKKSDKGSKLNTDKKEN